MSELTLQQRIDAALERLECVLIDASTDLRLTEVSYEDLVRVRDMLTTGEWKPDQPGAQHPGADSA